MKKRIFSGMTPLRLIALTLALIMLLPGVNAFAGEDNEWYVKTPDGKTVNIRDEKTNEVIGHIPYGTKVFSDPSKDAQTAAYVTYNGVSGFVNYRYLVKERPADYRKTESAAATEASLEPVTYGEGTHVISVTGGVVQMTNKKGKATGTKYSAVRFDDPVTVAVTASVPKGKKIDYWLINGVKMKPGSKTITILGEETDVTVEIIYK